MKVYSPSQTSEWLRCPIKRALRREGWMAREVGPKDYAAALGKAFAAGVGVHNTLKKNSALGAPQDVLEAILGTGKTVLDQEIKKWEELGLSLAPDTETNSLQRVALRLEKALKRYIEKDPLPSRWSVVAVEDDLGEEAGYARPDLIVRDEVGLAVVDYKTRTKLPAEWRHRSLQEYAHSGQMMHYAHFVSRKYNEPVTRFYIGLCVMEPQFQFDFVMYPIHEENLKAWLAGRQVVWANMAKEDAGEVPPYMAEDHSDKFGKCEYYKACFEHHWDPYLMMRDYLHLHVEKGKAR